MSEVKEKDLPIDRAQALKSGFATVKRCNYAGLDFCFKFQKAME